MIKVFLLNIIRFIEFIQYFNREKDDNPMNKFVDILPINNLKVMSRNGYVNISEINKTIPSNHFKIILENGYELECADNHILIGEYEQILTKDLKLDDYILTDVGFIKVKSIKRLKYKTAMFDFSLDDTFEYYTNNILSHNTVSAAIYILWFITFHDDKGCMIVANKGATVQEIIDKIKNIYKLMPFFLKRGVISWNNKSLTLDNGCRIKTENRSKEPAIGFTIDLLYFDEFAKVPDNILRVYYGSAVPTVSSMEESKIMITSTPDGYNLFYDLLTGAEKPVGDPNKNEYASKRVYWYQVKGRRDTKIKPIQNKLDKYKIILADIKHTLVEEHGFDIYTKTQNNRAMCIVKFYLDDEKTHMNSIKKIRIKGVPLLELCEVTNWQEEQTKLIGGESLFRQEYGIEFITGDKLLFDDIELQKLQENEIDFENVKFPNFDKRLILSYENLRWLKDKPDIFNINEAKNYHIFGGIDLGEGLGQDFTVMLLFRLLMKDKEYIKKNKHKFSTIYDYFKIEQIGYFRNNTYSVREFAHLFYMTIFELFDPEKCKMCLEYNGPGSDLLHYLPNVFEGNNDYSSSVFTRYKHTADATLRRPGIKVGNNKLSIIKNYQDSIKKENIIIHDQTTIHETKTFTRHDTPSGDYTYKASTGNDDSIMSAIVASTIFDNIDFKNIVDNYIASDLSEADRNFIEDRVSENSETLADHYSSLINSRKNMNKQNVKQNKYQPISNPFDRYH